MEALFGAATYSGAVILGKNCIISGQEKKHISNAFLKKFMFLLVLILLY